MSLFAEMESFSDDTGVKILLKFPLVVSGIAATILGLVTSYSLIVSIRWL